MTVSQKDNPPKASLEPWTFTMAVTAASLQYSTKLKDDSLVSHYSAQLEGLVRRGQPLIQNASVAASIWAEGENFAHLAQVEQAIGRATISKDVATTHDFSIAPSRPVAGIDITVRVTETAIRQFWDALSKGDLRQVLMEFGCTGTDIRRERFSKPELILRDADVDVRVIAVSVNTGFGRFAEVTLNELER